MSSIREFEHVLNDPPGDAPGRFSEEERRRLQQNAEEQERMRPIEGEVTPRFRHVEHRQAPQHEEGAERGESEKSGMFSGMSSLIDDDKVKLISEKGHDAKELIMEKGHDAKELIMEKGHDAKELIKEKTHEAKEAIEKAIGGDKSWGWVKWLLGLMAALMTLLFVAMMTMMFARTMLPYPSHASCEMNVTFYNDQFLKTTPICENVKSAFVHQMKLWEGPENCKDGGMKCLYKVTHVGDDELTGSHKTSDWFGFTDEITLKFMDTPQGDCLVRAFSRSTVPFAYFDFSVNYCNIHNLIEGYGFEKYDEVTSDEVCTQYSTHDCEKY